MIYYIIRNMAAIALVIGFLVDAISASPSSKVESHTLMRRVDPQFPDNPPSCPICAQNYGSISSCAQAAPVLANFSMVIFNPGAFIDVIKCSCTDTFQAVFPQCVDCFIQTNQTDILNTPNLPGLVDNIRKVCSYASALLGNKTATTTMTPTATSGAEISSHSRAAVFVGGIIALGICLL